MKKLPLLHLLLINDSVVASLGFIPHIYETLIKYDLLHHFQLWFSESIFPCYENWNVREQKPRKREYHLVSFCIHHSALQSAQVCLENVSPHQFWSIANNFPDLVSRLHVQIRLMGNFGLNGGMEFHGFPTLMVPIVFSARRVSKTLVISSLIVQNSKITLNLCGLI